MSTSPGLRVLVVDDDPHIRHIAEAAALRTGLFRRVSLAENGMAALQVLAESATLPDLVLTDLSMPLLDGLGLIETMQHNVKWSHVPVAMFSSSDLPHDRARALEAGCIAFFEKPIGIANLEAMFTDLAEHLRLLAH